MTKVFDSKVGMVKLSIYISRKPIHPLVNNYSMSIAEVDNSFTVLPTISSYLEDVNKKRVYNSFFFLFHIVLHINNK